ncbi:hypothetical protein [Chryseobacterium sp. SIMBA_029]|uniref:hypothetical protein n=1 Tax=Chryseobacterium sp. SIMBA_029 TaxID=3085772 RepID=UPI00397BE0F3
MNIVSKFTVGSDEGIDNLFDVIRPSVSSLYKELVPKEDIKNYIQHLDRRKVINELNDLSNQLIMTYLDEQPIGYSILKSGSRYPGLSEEKRATELSFVILQEYNSPEVRQSHWKKCRAAVAFTDIIWINMLINDPLLEFLKESGFSIVEETHSGPFQLPSYLLTMDITKG